MYAKSSFKVRPTDVSNVVPMFSGESNYIQQHAYQREVCDFASANISINASRTGPMHQFIEHDSNCIWRNSDVLQLPM